MHGSFFSGSGCLGVEDPVDPSEPDDLVGSVAVAVEFDEEADDDEVLGVVHVVVPVPEGEVVADPRDFDAAVLDASDDLEDEVRSSSFDSSVFAALRC